VGAGMGGWGNGGEDAGVKGSGVGLGSACVAAVVNRDRQIAWLQVGVWWLGWQAGPCLALLREGEWAFLGPWGGAGCVVSMPRSSAHLQS
jgi:hypothetical protein